MKDRMGQMISRKMKRRRKRRKKKRKRSNKRRGMPAICGGRGVAEEKERAEKWEDVKKKTWK